MKNKIKLFSLMMVITLTFTLTPATKQLTTTASTEMAWFPLSVLNVTQIAYESYSHGSINAIDCVGSDWLFAPFTGKVVYVSKNYTLVFYQSINKVQFADGSYDYMTVQLLHGSNYDQLVQYRDNGTIIKQGEKFL